MCAWYQNSQRHAASAGAAAPVAPAARASPVAARLPRYGEMNCWSGYVASAPSLIWALAIHDASATVTELVVCARAGGDHTAPSNTSAPSTAHGACPRALTPPYRPLHVFA